MAYVLRFRVMVRLYVWNHLGTGGYRLEALVLNLYTLYSKPLSSVPV